MTQRVKTLWVLECEEPGCERESEGLWDHEVRKPPSWRRIRTMAHQDEGWRTRKGKDYCWLHRYISAAVLEE